MNFLLLASAPVIIIAFYIYFRDRYEKEPLGMLMKSVLIGAVIVLPVSLIEIILSIPLHHFSGYMNPAWNAFVVAGFTEELFKFLVLYFMIWKNKNFNEPFDGIVYAVFISLGFALIENILYVINGGMEVAVLRAFTAVPAHALFGVAMGFYFAKAKYKPASRVFNILLCLLIPIILHGSYDFILMSGNSILITLFIPYMIYLGYQGLKMINASSEDSRPGAVV